jgi:hypothetical protein
LARVARRLAAIDPERRGVGGLRLQVELALFAAAEARAATGSAAPSPPAKEALAPAPEPAPPAPAPPAPAPAPPAPPAPAPDPEPVADPSRPNLEVATAPAQMPVAAKSAKTRPSATSEPDRTASFADSPPDQSPTPSPAPPPASDSPDLAELRAQWADIVADISQNPPAKPLIAACRPISVDGNVVTLGFPEGQAFLRDALERRRPLLEEGIGRHLGRAVAVRCVATNLDLIPPPPGDDGADPMWTEARRIFGDDLADIGEVS